MSIEHASVMGGGSKPRVAFVKSIRIENAITKAEHHDDSSHELRRESSDSGGQERACLSVQNHTRSGSVYWTDSLLSTILNFSFLFFEVVHRIQFTGSLF